MSAPRKALVLAAVAASLAACSGGTPAGATPTNGTSVVALGSAMTARNGLSVTVTSFNPEITPLPIQQPSPGRACVEVTVTEHNGSPNQWNVPGWELSIVDANGQKFGWDNGLVTCPSSEDVNAIVAGGTVTQHLYFLVPSAGALDLNWSPAFEGEIFQTHLR